MAWHGYSGLLPYFGGKRRLCPRIFKEISRIHPVDTWSRLRLVDPFLGGGAVSLYAKARGFGVICGDLAERSVIVGEALIANDSVRLSDADILRLFVASEGNQHRLERGYVPDCFTREAARFLDNAFAVAEEVQDRTKRALLRLLLVKYVFSLAPHTHLRSPGAFNRPLAEGRYDEIKATYRTGLAANVRHPLPVLRRLARSINRSVFQDAQPCHAMKADAQETIRTGEGAEILYLDPPYSGTVAYEQEYRLLDEILGDVQDPSPYSRREGLECLADLLQACGGYPLWVISYGNAVADMEAVCRTIERFRPVRAVEMRYEHLGSIASEEKREKNREFILLAGDAIERSSPAAGAVLTCVGTPTGRQ